MVPSGDICVEGEKDRSDTSKGCPWMNDMTYIQLTYPFYLPPNNEVNRVPIFSLLISIG